MDLNKITKKGNFRLVGCFGVLGLLTIAMLCPMRAENVNAVPELTEGQSRSDRASDLRVYIQSAISLAMNDRLDVDVVPKSNGNFSSAGTQVAVATNNSTGYGIYMSTKDGTQNLTSTNSEVSNVIGPVTGAVSSNNFPVNSWGYQLLKGDGTVLPGDDGLYKAVPLPTDGVVYNTALADGTLSAKDTYQLNFGASVNTEIPAGVYTNSIVVSVVANPRQIQNLGEAMYMQDMDGTRNANGTTKTASRICENSPIGMTNQLIDTRDGKKYYVAKLADGNCWMTQNLDLDITTKGFSEADTDLSIAEWGASTTGRVKPVNTSTTVPTVTSNPDQNTTMSWNFGEWVLATPIAAEFVSGGNSCGDTTNIANCRANGFVDVSDKTKWTPTYHIEDSTEANAEGEIFYQQKADGTKGTAPSGMGVKRQPLAIKWNEDGTGGEYDPHYLIGNYYQFNTATAGSGALITSGNAVDSICPRGWHLPTSGAANDNISGSFNKLLVQYGVNANVTGTGLSTNEATAGKSYNIALGPLHFVRSGFIDRVVGAFSGASYFGFGWSSMANSVSQAYYLTFSNDTTYTRYNLDRYLVISLRCLAY